MKNDEEPRRLASIRVNDELTFIVSDETSEDPEKVEQIRRIVQGAGEEPPLRGSNIEH